MELSVLYSLTHALIHTHAFVEVEPVVARYREVAKAEWEKRGSPVQLGFAQRLCTRARLREVLCTC